MSTSNSPDWKLRAEAKKMAKLLKAFHSGDTPCAARDKDEIKFNIAMDDKMLIITMKWDLIGAYSRDELIEFIVKYMKGNQETTQ